MSQVRCLLADLPTTAVTQFLLQEPQRIEGLKPIIDAASHFAVFESSDDVVQFGRSRGREVVPYVVSRVFVTLIDVQLWISKSGKFTARMFSGSYIALM